MQEVGPITIRVRNAKSMEIFDSTGVFTR